MSFENVTWCSGWAASRDPAAIVKAQTKAKLVAAVTADGGTGLRATFFAFVTVVAIRHMGSIGGTSGRQDPIVGAPSTTVKTGRPYKRRPTPCSGGRP